MTSGLPVIRPGDERLGGLSPSLLGDPQSVHMVIDASYAHRPRKTNEPDSVKNCPSMRLHHAVCLTNCSEWILLALACDKGAGLTASCSDDTIANENRHSVSLSLDHVPDLSNSCKVGNPMRKIEVGRIPPLRSSWTDVTKTPFGSESTHRPCAKTMDDLHHAGDQQNYCKYLE
jgi:hypothetical protein